MRWRAVGLALIASAVVGCEASPGPSTSASPTVPPTPSPAAPSVRPSIPPSPTAGPAAEVAVPSTDTPARTGEIGLDWERRHVDAGLAGSALANGPGGWVYLLSSDLDVPVLPEVVFSPDLRSYEVVTPTSGGVQCGDGGSIVATSTTWLMRCGGLFRSADGRSWEAVPGLSGALLDDIRHLASDGRTFVAWRGDYPADTAIWTSIDGARWTRVELPGAPFVRVDAAIGRSMGGFVLAGRTAATADDLREANDMQWHSLPGVQGIWTAEVGGQWTSAPVGSTFDGGRITGLAADGPGGGLLAVGYRGALPETDVRQRPTVWRTSDLVTWQRLAGVAFDVLEWEAGQVRILATTNRWLLVGARLHEDAANEWDLTPYGVTAGSEDGTAWWTVWPVALDSRPYSIEAIAAPAGHLVLLGNQPADSIGSLVDASIWMSPPLD